MELENRISFEDERRFAQVQLDGWGIWHAFSTHLSWFSRSGI